MSILMEKQQQSYKTQVHLFLEDFDFEEVGAEVTS